MPKRLMRAQEQASAAWITYLNQQRIIELLKQTAVQDHRLAEALEEIRGASLMIETEVVQRLRGGMKGMHGFIAEICEVGVSNARNRVDGGTRDTILLNDNGPTDIMRAGVRIQQKFYASDNAFSLKAAQEHFSKYPHFLSDGGRYQIPRDQYETLKQLVEMPESVASKHLSKSGDGPSFRDWLRVRDFFSKSALKFEDIEPSKVDYRDVQQGAYKQTLLKEEESILSLDHHRREGFIETSKASVGEGTKVALVSGLLEGGTAFVIGYRAKRKAGKTFRTLDEEDWNELLAGTGEGGLKGAARGGSVYFLSNKTATPAAVATAFLTASFAMAEQVHAFRLGECSEEELLMNCELACVEVTLSALYSIIGQALIPVPVLGAIIGNQIGFLIDGAISQAVNEKEKALLDSLLSDQAVLDEQLNSAFQELVREGNEAFDFFSALLQELFDPDLSEALEGSIALARSLGVQPEEILDSPEKAYSYFMD